MKTKIILLIIALTFLQISSVFSEEKILEGDVGVQGLITDIEGNKAKANEYRDINSGVFIDSTLNYNNLLKFKASDIGHNTQLYRLDGIGKGIKGYIQYREITQNITDGAKTIFSGAGTNNLTYSGASSPSTSTAAILGWNTFDYSTTRKQYEGGVKVGLLKPWFLDASVSTEKKKGISATGIVMSNFYEMPAPVDYTTNVINVGAGYAENPLFAAINLYYSQFDNLNQQWTFSNPNISGNPLDTLFLPPDNKYYKVTFNSAIKLPYNSKFSVNYGYSMTKTETTLIGTYYNSSATTTTTNILSDPIFNGNLTSNNYAFILSTNPLSSLSGKVYYKSYTKTNSSDQISSATKTGTGATSTPFTNLLFDYKKTNYGIEANFKLPADFLLTAGYSNLKIDRDRLDLPITKDNIYSSGLRWNGLDFMSARIGYELLSRSAEHGTLTNIATSSQAYTDLIETYIRRFDATSQKRNTYKASVDIYPVQDLNFTLGYNYNKSDYTDTKYGLISSTRDNPYLSADYATDKYRVFGYYDLEDIKSNNFQIRTYTAYADANTTNINPTNLDSGTATYYNWGLAQREKTSNYGAGSDIYLIPKKLTMRVSYDYIGTDGSADFTFYTTASLDTATILNFNNDTADISNYDTYKKTSILIKFLYNITRSLSATAGYVYEKYKYNDYQNDGFNYTYGTNFYLTGINTNPDYKSSVVFMGMKYTF